MGIHTAEAIVLRRYPFRETSVTLTCLTDKFGKMKGLVKGLRAQPNRHRSAMEPFTVNRIVFYETRTSQLHLISQCDLVAPLTELQSSLERMQLAALCVDVVDTVVPIEEPQPAIYHLLKQTLERLALGAPPEQAIIRTHFIVRLLKLAGFHPQLAECTGCGTYVQHHPGYWSAKQGGLLCERCLHEDPKADTVEPKILDALSSLSDAAQPTEVTPELALALNERLDDFLRWRLDRPLKTLTA